MHEPIVETSTKAGSLGPIRWASEDDCAAWGQALALSIQTAMRADPSLSVVIELIGDLGAGKSTLARHILKAMGVTGRIKSPTYPIVESYDQSGLSLWHFDFYRFNNPDEWDDAGFRDIFASAGLKLIEWPKQAGEHLPVPDLRVHLRMDIDAPESSRVVDVFAFSPLGQRLISP